MDSSRAEDVCSCPHLFLDLRETESRNWNPDCPEHGIQSDWYQSEEQKAKREAAQRFFLFFS